MTRPKGTREQIHDLVNELDEMMLDVVLMRLKDAVDRKKNDAARKPPPRYERGQL